MSYASSGYSSTTPLAGSTLGTSQYSSATLAGINGYSQVVPTTISQSHLSQNLPQTVAGDSTLTNSPRRGRASPNISSGKSSRLSPRKLSKNVDVDDINLNQIPSPSRTSSRTTTVKGRTINKSYEDPLELEIRDYSGLINNSSLEAELVNNGYVPLSKIVVKDEGINKTQYIKALNKNGQKVFIMIDVEGYNSARTTDLTLVEANNASIIPFSLKMGAMTCAEKDVCGVAFECGADAVCVVARQGDDLTPKETSFIYVEPASPPSTAIMVSEGSIMTYPVVKLSEIRANNALVLQNIDIATRNLRNTSYQSVLADLLAAQESLMNLNIAFSNFNAAREMYAKKIKETLDELEGYNREYILNPPITDDSKEAYRQLQFNLAKRNDGISYLLTASKRVADHKKVIDNITTDINNTTEFCTKEFAQLGYANVD